MRLRILAVLTALAALTLFSVSSVAVDPPHWGGDTNEGCNTSCHALHTAAGAQLTASAGNVNLCQSCHNPAGTATDLSLLTIDIAVPGVGGTSHAFGANATNPAVGAVPPTSSTEMALRIMDNDVVCSTCHDQHRAQNDRGGSSRIGNASKVASGGGSGSLSTGGTYTGTVGVWYLIQIDADTGPGTPSFQWSKDNGTSWMATGVDCNVPNPVALDNGVTITFPSGAATYSTGDTWQFSASWPFLREALDSGDNTTGDRFCRDCHQSWAMDHNGARTYDGNPNSHPIGITLGANGGGYDRVAPLDANGLAQNPGDRDGNSTNDLQLDGSGLVQCLTCHGVHWADGVTSTVDGP